jgi:hypothetical protein
MRSILKTTLVAAPVALLAMLGTAQAGGFGGAGLTPIAPFNTYMPSDDTTYTTVEDASDMVADAAEDTITDAAIVAHDLMEDALDQ